MKHRILLLALGLALTLSSPAHAACIAAYKAKMDDPLRLDYGEMAVPSETCTRADVRDYVAGQLASQGWTLLTIVSVREE
ncbi:hypothetical protein [Anianabacter salinae]|uniref:hypothetical protein n=1 Tax=Anianabacter salinae TaxID=2851023 RepID=UPI00225E45C5|nr:hypothetical protein [Anianabacter salinae]MBV0913637.1 hypothetical protein [Anianabacter salinae]